MDTEWSNKNKKMQTLIAKEATFADGIKVLLELRAELSEQITSIVKTFPPVAFFRCLLGWGRVRIIRRLPGRSGTFSALKILLCIR